MIEVYRKLSRIDAFDQLAELETELRDRFGPVPDVVQNLFELKKLQLMARFWQIDDIHLEDDFIVFKYRNSRRIRDLATHSRRDLRVVDDRSAYLPLSSASLPASEILELAKSLLQIS